MRQLIIVRKDLNMSVGKLATQVSHASMAFLTREISQVAVQRENDGNYLAELIIPCDIYEEWINGIFTKTICRAKNKSNLMKATKIAEDLGLVENRDFYLIKDACLTELAPEDFDDNGQGSTLTCIGFRPLPDEVAHKISMKYQLY